MITLQCKVCDEAISSEQFASDDTITCVDCWGF